MRFLGVGEKSRETLREFPLKVLFCLACQSTGLGCAYNGRSKSILLYAILFTFVLLHINSYLQNFFFQK